MKMRGRIEIIISALAVLSGVALLFVGLYMEPPGEIDASLLVAYGETLTFAGAVIGVDYHYQAMLSKRKDKSNEGRTNRTRKSNGESRPRNKGEGASVD